LKHLDLAIQGDLPESPPSRGRGLKRFAITPPPRCARIAPITGARIET